MKKIKMFISVTIITVFVLSFFTLVFSMAVVDGNNRELKKEINSLPYRPFYIAKISDPAQLNMNYNTVKAFNNPISFLLFISGEEMPNILHSTHSLREPDWKEINYITEEDAEKLKDSPYIEDAFVGDEFTNKEFLKVNKIIIPMMFMPASFFNKLKIPLQSGRYFSDNSALNEIVITSRLSHLIFGNKDPIGKTIFGTSFKTPNYNGGISSTSFNTKYTVVGVLKPITNNSLLSSFGETEAFAALPGNFIPLSELGSYKQEGLNPLPKLRYIYELHNTLYVLPKKGKYKEALNILKKVMKDKGEKGRKDISPNIISTYESISSFLSIKSRQEKLQFLMYVVIFNIFVAIFTTISFLLLELFNRKFEISIKRALGANNRVIFKENFAKYFWLSALALAISFLLVFTLSPELKNINISGGISKIGIPFSSAYATHFIYVGWRTIVVGVIVSVFSIFISLHISLKMILNTLPADGLRGNIADKNIKPVFNKIILIVIISVSISGILFPLVIRKASVDRLLTAYKEVQPEVIRIMPNIPLVSLNKKFSTNFALGNPVYTYDDYLAVKKFIGDKCLVDYRPDKPRVEDGVRVVGATPSTISIYNLKVLKGRFFSTADMDKPECVLGFSYANKNSIRLGDVVTFHNMKNGLSGPSSYKVIGILSADNPLIDNTVFFPAKLTPSLNVSFGNSINILGKGIILLKPKRNYNRKDIANAVLLFLNKRHKDSNSGAIYDIEEYFKIIYRTSTSLYTLLSIFTFLALLSSFLSLSALLFIEVIRRTREIGIKKAIGATSKEITKEFTLKGLKTTIIALSIGIPVGILISLIIEKIKGWSYYIPVNILILVISVSLLLGFIFSFLPAYFASKTNPVEAIKSE